MTAQFMVSGINPLSPRSSRVDPGLVRGVANVCVCVGVGGWGGGGGGGGGGVGGGGVGGGGWGGGGYY